MCLISGQKYLVTFNTRCNQSFINNHFREINGDLFLALIGIALMIIKETQPGVGNLSNMKWHFKMVSVNRCAISTLQFTLSLIMTAHQILLPLTMCRIKKSIYVSWVVPGDGLWGWAHISGSSKTEPDLPNGQLHAARVRRRGHEGEVFLQVIWLYTFILQSTREQGLTSRWDWLVGVSSSIAAHFQPDCRLDLQSWLIFMIRVNRS